MKRIIKYILTLTLVLTGVFLFALNTSATTPEFRADDQLQRIILTTNMPVYNGSSGYALHTLGFLLNISDVATSKTVFLEGDVDYHQLSYANIIAEFYAEHGTSGKTLAENYFYGGVGTMTLDTVFTLWQRGGGYLSYYDDYKCTEGGYVGWVQAKINDSANVHTPVMEVYASNWASQIKLFPVKFWDWSTKSYAWSYYAERLNSLVTDVYTLTPYPFTADTVRTYPTPYYAADWQNAAMLCEFNPTATQAIREYYKRTIVRQSVIKDFGVWGLYADAYDVYEYDPITLSVNFTNYKNASFSKVPVEILIDGAVVYTEYLSFGPYETISKSYYLELNGGDGNREIVVRINWAEHALESDPTDNERYLDINAREYYEFSISNLEVSPTSVYQNNTVTVTFRTDSWNYSRAYSNIPIEILYDGAVIYTDYTSFSPYGLNYHSYNINVGSAVGSHTVSARINWPNKEREVNPNNNETAGKVITVQAATNLQIEHIDTFGNYREGTEVITSFRVKNIGGTGILPSHNLKVSLQIDGYTTLYKSQVVIPPNGDNLVYFKWTVPSGTAGRTLTLVATVNPDGAVSEANTGDNSIVVYKPVLAMAYSTTPDTQFVKSAPPGFQKINPPGRTNVTSATWSEWVYENNTFVKKTYGIRLDTTMIKLEPDAAVPSRKYQNGRWQMPSGYGFTVYWTVETATLSRTISPPDSAYTAPQTAMLLLPEFKFSTDMGFYRSLVRTAENVFELPSNPYASNHARLHFVPLWYPDGDYIVQGVVSDLWTPAGMLTGSVRAAISISGSAYDDWYVGR